MNAKYVFVCVRVICIAMIKMDDTSDDLPFKMVHILEHYFSKCVNCWEMTHETVVTKITLIQMNDKYSNKIGQTMRCDKLLRLNL